jgi:lactoylglutathione lyase
MMNIAINHILLRTNDLEGMIQFFEQALELKKGYRPDFPFSGAWLWSDDKPLIHLSEAKPDDHGQLDYLGDKKHALDKPEMGTGIVDHIAFSGSDYQSLIQRLKNHQLTYFERSIPLTGERQIFVEGPEGVRVEIQFENNVIT